MTGTEIVSEIITILTAGITQTASAIGAGLSDLVKGIFMTGTGDNETLSTFGIVVLAFAGVSLALSLCRLIYEFVTSLGRRNK